MVGRLSAFEFGWAKFLQIQRGLASEKNENGCHVFTDFGKAGLIELAIEP